MLDLFVVAVADPKKYQGGEAEDEKEKFKETEKRTMKKTRKISLNPQRKRKRSRPLL